MSRKKLRKQSVEAGGISSTSAEVDYDTLPPVFSLEYLTGEFSLSLCNQTQKAAFADALHKRSRMKWGEIKRAPRHGLGLENISRHSIKAAVPDHVPDDMNNFIALRFWEKAPMVGYRDGRVFYILWLDRTYSLYDHGS